MHNTALPICFFLFLLFVVCNSDFSSLYDEALALLNSNNHTECISVLHKCIDLDPNSYDALQLLGSLYISIYQPLVGSEYLHRALLINDRDPIMLANYIESLRASNQNQRALEVGQRSISMHPQSFHIAFNLGVVEEELGITKDALAHYTLALTLSPTSQAVCERKAGLLLRTGQFESAEQVLRVATEMQPGNPYLHYHLGVALHKQNKFSLALAAYNIAEQLNPDLMDVQSNIGAVYHSLGQSEAALQRYLKALPHREGDAGLLNNIGSLYGGMGKTKKEVMFLTRALEIEPGKHQDGYGLGCITHTLTFPPISPHHRLTRRTFQRTNQPCWLPPRRRGLRAAAKVCSAATRIICIQYTTGGMTDKQTLTHILTHLSP